MAKEQKADNGSQPAVPMGKTGIIILGISLIVAAFLLGYLLYALWYQPPPDETGKIPDVTIHLFGFSVTISDGVRLVLLVLVMGLIGSYIHTVVSFVNFAGDRKLVKSWRWFYVTKPFAGPFLALLFYLVLRGGLLSAGVGSEDINQYGILAFGGLAGLFSNQAIEKLAEVFDTLFLQKKQDQHKDQLDAPEPVIDSIEPSSVPQGKETKVSINGKNFVKGSKVLIDGNKRDDDCYKDANTLEIVIKPEETKGRDKLVIQVLNPDGDKSNECRLTVSS